MSKCKWCKKETKLCRAHLLPDGLKKFLMGEETGVKVMIRASIIIKKDTPIQTLEADSNILCSACDGKLGVYDQILISFFEKYIVVQESEVLVKWKPIYLEFKHSKKLMIAFLVILYRFSISSRHPQINLGNTYKKLFEKWFENGCVNQDVSCVDIKIFGTSKDKNGLHKTIITSPEWAKVEGVNIYIFDLFGLTVFVKIGKLKWPLSNMEKYPTLGEKSNLVEFPMLPFDYQSSRSDKFRKLVKAHRF